MALSKKMGQQADFDTLRTLIRTSLIGVITACAQLYIHTSDI